MSSAHGVVVVVFCDLSGSTAAMWEHGVAIEAPAIVARLDEVEAGLRESLQRDQPRREVELPVYNGIVRLSTAGDGSMMVGADILGLVRATLRVQADWMVARHGLAARLSIGLGHPTWEGPPFTVGSSLRGSFVNLTARLLDICPPGGVVLTEAAYHLVAEVPTLRERFRRAEAKLKGIGLSTFWRTGDRMDDEEGSDVTGYRLKALEVRMAKVESSLQWGMYLLVANLVGVIVTLALKLAGK